MKKTNLLKIVLHEADLLKEHYSCRDMTAELLLEAIARTAEEDKEEKEPEKDVVISMLNDQFEDDISGLISFLEEYNSDPRRSGEPVDLSTLAANENDQLDTSGLLDDLLKEVKGRLLPLYEDWKHRQKKSTAVEVRPGKEVPMMIPKGETLPAALPEELRKDAADLTAKAEALQKKLFQTVRGQNQAISFLVSGWLEGEMRNLMGPVDERPRATVLFAGPHGTGMSLLVHTFAKEVNEPLYVLSGMADDGGNITASAMISVLMQGNKGKEPARKKCIFLIDHMEPGACPYGLQAFFARIMDGEVQNEGRVSFRDCILIFTTSAGSASLYDNPDIPDCSVLRADEIIDALRKETFADKEGKKHPAFIPSFLDYCAQGKAAVFTRVSAPVMREIAAASMQAQADQMEKNMGITVSLDPDLSSAVLFRLGEKASADTARYEAQDIFVREMTELFRITKAHLPKVKSVDFRLDKPETGETADLFRQNKKQEVLAFMKEDDRSSLPSDALLHVNYVSTPARAEKILTKKDIRLILLDYTLGLKEKNYSNIEDIESAGRSFFFWLRKEHADIPVYIVETSSHHYSEEEKLSFMRHGTAGFLSLNDKLVDHVHTIIHDFHLNDSLLYLEKIKGRLSWGSRQKVDEEGNAVVELFDLNIRRSSLFQAGEGSESDVEMPDLKFDDIIGADDAKEELKFFIRYLRNPRAFMGSGLEAPKGVLLYGPPGTGKTMLAKAMASEAGIAFIACEGSEFLKKYVGEGPELVHRYFQQARKFAPAVLFIDEIDAIGLNRASDDARYSRDILTSFFTEMDGFHTSPTKPVFVMAATNASVEPGTPGSLDPALLRRFDRRILVDLPDSDGRTAYLHKQMKEYPSIHLSEEEVHTIAENTAGLSLAVIAQILNLAKRLALRNNSHIIDEKLITEAMEQYTSGDRRKRSEAENLRTARHEAGHAFLQWKAGKHPAYISIESRSDHHGYVRSSEEEFENMNSKKEILDYIRWCLGGRAAELVYYGKDDGLTMGPSQDLRQATDAAVQLYCTFGMDEEFGLASVDPDDLSSKKREELLERVNDLLRKELKEGEDEISANRNTIDAFVKILMVKEHLNGNEIDDIFTRETKK